MREMLGLIAVSLFSFNVSAQNVVTVGNDLGFFDYQVNLPTLNPVDGESADAAEMTVEIVRTAHSKDNVTLVGKFNREKRKCVEYAEEGWIGQCAAFEGTGKFVTKKYKINVDFSDAVSLSGNQKEIYTITFGVKSTIDRKPVVFSATLNEGSALYSEQVISVDGQNVYVEPRI